MSPKAVFGLNTFFFFLQLRKGKVSRKHSLHEEKSSLGFIEAVHQW